MNPTDATRNEWRDAVYAEERNAGESHAQARNFADGASYGAGWAFAIVGMFQAIADGVREGRFSKENWEYIGNGQWVRI